MGSGGSWIASFLNKAKKVILPITDSATTLFNISLKEGLEMMHCVLEHALGGELFVLKIPSYRIADVAESIGLSCEKPITGIRLRVKIHEEIITASDGFSTFDFGDYCAILAYDCRVQRLHKKAGIDSRPVSKGFSCQGLNLDFFSVKRLWDLIRDHWICSSSQYE